MKVPLVTTVRDIDAAKVWGYLKGLVGRAPGPIDGSLG